MLFGHQADNTTSALGADNAMSGANPLAVDPATGSSVPATTNDNMPTGATNPSNPEPMLDNPLSDESVIEPAEDTSGPAAENSASEASSHMTAPGVSGSDDLLSLKQQALSQLSPLVDHLDQSPEEKFKTTMMMLQSTDNQALLKEAYEAAQAISDDKARAQALLDVINEINYFTQKSNDAQ
ncbi:hypothetical protein KDA14_02085 [Candidatus Saccharibacteria bacterium]|nr:hypothetical protein [Candidatus Saccharibacteria bacterium]